VRYGRLKSFKAIEVGTNRKPIASPYATSY